MPQPESIHWTFQSVDDGAFARRSCRGAYAWQGSPRGRAMTALLDCVGLLLVRPACEKVESEVRRLVSSFRSKQLGKLDLSSWSSTASRSVVLFVNKNFAPRRGGYEVLIRVAGLQTALSLLLPKGRGVESALETAGSRDGKPSGKGVWWSSD
jgi:hypothetical protein